MMPVDLLSINANQCADPVVNEIDHFEPVRRSPTT